MCIRDSIESALGGVLFIDEAYSLYRGEQDSFGLEAIDTLCLLYTSREAFPFRQRLPH